MENWVQIGISFVGGSGLVALIQVLANRRKARADAGDITMGSMLKYQEGLRERVDKLEQALEVLRKENIGLHREVASLRTELAFYRKETPHAVAGTTV